jgi:hypothetical protein
MRHKLLRLARLPVPPLPQLGERTTNEYSSQKYRYRTSIGW